MISTGQARAIAAEWQTPRNAYSVYASTGIITDDLIDDIEDDIHRLETRDASLGIYITHDDDGIPDGGWVTGDIGTVEENIDALTALREHLLGSEVTPWVVGWGAPGCLPEMDPAVFLSWGDAIDYLRDELVNEMDVPPRNGESWESVADEVSDALVMLPTRYMGAREASVTVRSLVYWIQLGEPMTYSTYLEAR